MEVKDLEVGKSYFYYSDNIGMNTMICQEIVDAERVIFMNGDKRVALSLCTIRDLGEKKNETMINFYRKQTLRITKKIERRQFEANTHKEELRNLDKTFSHLKDEYPEEFI
jgi:hypothetical protein